MQRLSLLLLLIFATAPAFAQRVSPENMGVRYLAIDTVITDDQGRKLPAHARGMLGFVVIAYNAEKTMVLVELTGARHSDFDALKKSTDARIRWFDKAIMRKEQLRDAARSAGFTNADVDKIEKAFVRGQ